MKILFEKDSTKIRILGVLIGCGLIYVDISYGVGFLSGLIISEIYLWVLNAYMAHALSKQAYQWKSGLLVFMARNLLLFVPFVLTLVYPAYVNIFAAVIGLTYFKVCIYIKYLLFRDKD